LPSSDTTTMNFEAFDDRPGFDTGASPAGDDLGFLAGSWKAFAPAGQIVMFRFRPTNRDTTFAVDSAGFIAPATFRVDRQFERSDSTLPATVVEGSITGSFRGDAYHAPRSSPLKLTCLDRNTILAETRYLRWDGAGRTLPSLFWPFRMIRNT